MGMYSNFINNWNVMLGVFYGYLVLSGIFTIIFKLTLSQKMQYISMHILKQGMITLAMFNCFNVAFSAGVHWKYASL